MMWYVIQQPRRQEKIMDFIFHDVKPPENAPMKRFDRNTGAMLIFNASLNCNSNAWDILFK